MIRFWILDFGFWIGVCQKRTLTPALSLGRASMVGRSLPAKGEGDCANPKPKIQNPKSREVTQ
jgi:hypothetical protein